MGSDEDMTKEADKNGENGAAPPSPNSSSDERLDEDEENSVPEFEERDLSVSTSLTVDEDLCLRYCLKCGDNLQPKGNCRHHASLWNNIDTVAIRRFLY